MVITGLHTSKEARASASTGVDYAIQQHGENVFLALSISIAEGKFLPVLDKLQMKYLTTF